VDPATTSVVSPCVIPAEGHAGVRMRAVRHLGARPTASARAVLQRLDLLRLDDALLDAAGSLDAGVLRSLDAIHVAVALALAARLEAVVTYDARMAGAARRLGLRVAAPA
jgi:predicted nucleic acid-binding protein